MPVATTPARKSIQEYTSCAGQALKVDRTTGLIPSVKILGMTSKNGRVYTPECVARAAPLYENAACFIDHARGPRSYKDRIGSFTNVTPKPDGLYADFQANVKHPMFEQIAWDVENAPGNCGMSHNCEAVLEKRDKQTAVTEICEVHSVDLVAKPATTKGVFEGEDDLTSDPDLRELAEHSLSAISDARSALLGQGTIESKRTRLTEILAAWQSELAGSHTTPKGTNMEFKDLTLSALKEHRADLVEQLTGTDSLSKLTSEVAKIKEQLTAKDNELAAAKAQVATFEAEKSKLVLESTIQEEIKTAKLTTEQVSEVFLDNLRSAKDAEGRKKLIEDRQAIFKLVPAKAAPASPPMGVVVDATKRTGVQETLSFLRG